jgi:dehydrogenase/reductase SDR family protein 7
MEIADKNISILSVCPGPIDTPFMHNVFTEKLSLPADTNQPQRAGDHRVSAERCAELIAVTMANKLEEVWISNHPILFFVYVNQFLPNLAKW